MYLENEINTKLHKASNEVSYEVLLFLELIFGCSASRRSCSPFCLSNPGSLSVCLSKCVFICARILAADHHGFSLTGCRQTSSGEEKWRGNEREDVFCGGGHSELREMERAIEGGGENRETGAGTGYLCCCSVTGVRDALINVLLPNTFQEPPSSEPNADSPKNSKRRFC